MFLGGDAMEGPRHIWWNFVSSSQERIEQAKEDWRVGRFGLGAGRDGVHPAPGALNCDLKRAATGMRAHVEQTQLA